MRAAVMRNHHLVVDEVPVPEPGPGEVLVKTLACGICGSDLHALKFAEQLAENSRRAGARFVMDLSRDVVMGHEFCAEVVDFGPHTQRSLKPGARVVSMPVLLRAAGIDPIGYSNDNPGGYGELMRLTEMLLLEVPNGLSTERAALTEPMAVGYHAVRKARLKPEDAPLVIGCGPVGLAVIAALKLADVHPIVVADFSPRRRELAIKIGADVAVDPKQRSPYQSWQELAVYSDPATAPPQMPWMSEPPLRPAVIFECVGVPGVIGSIMASAPHGARVIVAGVCMEPDSFEPFFGIFKEINLQFALAYMPDEFATTLFNLAEGKINADPLITGKVGLKGVADAFEELASPDTHAKILIEPWRG